MGENRAAASGLFAGEDRLRRCIWCQASDVYRHYHDHEWGFPVTDETRLFEKICLEGFQAGLSWSTILHKRPAFREAFAGFDMERVARFGARDVQRLMDNAGIVRHRGKIDSAINNAKRALELREQYGSLAAYLWRYEPERASRPKRITYEALRAMTTSPESVALSKDLKKRGWTFVGPTTMYALMQAMGLVNDHIDGCHARKQALAARAALQSPV